MPNEERVRTKRRKLDSIISKLHRTTEASSKPQDEPLGENENGNQATHRQEEDTLPRTSRRKLQTVVKQKKVENFSDEKDNTASVEGDYNEQVNGEDGEAVIQESDTTCNGDNNPEVQISADVPVFKEEPVENSLAGLEQMLGYSISEEVEKQRGDNEKAKQKRDISDSSVDDKATNELPRRVQCTTCGREVNPAHGTICRHQSLNVLVCKKCSQYYNSGPFTRDEFGVEEQCHWCGDGGSLLCCDKCEKAFCKRCVKRNLGKTVLKAIVEAPGDAEWLCFSCNPKPLSKLLRKCNQIMDIVETLKAQKTIFKTKRGPSLVGVPNQKERRNRLNSLSENIGLTSGESPTKRNFPFDNDDGDDDSDEDHMSSNVKNKREKDHLNHRTKKDTKVMSNSVNKRDKTLNRKNGGSKTRQTRNQSDKSDSDEPKVRSRPKKKAMDKLPFNSSEDDSDFVSMVKGRGIEASSEKEPRSRQSKIKPPKISDSDDSSEEDAKGKRRNRRSQVVSQKRTRKRRRKVTSSDSESEVSGGKSDSDVPRRRKKKAKKQKRRATTESEEESEQTSVTKKKGKRKRKKLKSSSESDDDTSKHKWKGKGKGKQKRKRKKHYIEKDSNESEKSDHNEEGGNEEEISPSKQKGRRQIRKLIEDGKLAEETRKARRLEEERRKRLLERTQNNEDDLPGESSKVSKLVLESDPTTKEPTVEVKEDLLQHLKPHQSKGVQFMYDCVIESIKSWKKGESGGGCILAHCMGLGKTLQVVTLVHTLMNHKEINMMTVLVVAPINTVLNWQVEFEKWLSVDDRLEVYILQEVAGNNWRRADMLKHWVRYGGIMIMGYALYRNLSQSYRIRSKHQKKIFQEALVDPGPDLVICDEGHILRNDGSAISRALNGIKTRRRIVLTGTPLQNNLIEYHCMVSFVKPNLLGTRKEFTNTFVNPIQNGQCADSTALDVQLMKQRCHVLHKTLEGCVQRKDYSALTPFLPRKHEYVIKVRLSVPQKKLYEHFLKTFVFPEGDLGKRGVSLFSDYQALMRIWTHPWCFKLEALRRPEKFVDSDSMDDFVVHTDEEEEEEEEVESVKSTTTEEESEFQSSSDEEDDRARRRKRRNATKNQDSNTDDDDENGKSEEDEDENEEKSDEEVIPQLLGTNVKSSPTSVMNIDGEDITVVEINDSTDKSHKRAKGEGRKQERPHGSKEDKNDSAEKSKDVLVDGSGNGDNTAIQNGETNAYGSTRSGTSFKDGDVEIVEEKEWYDEFLQDEDEYNVELSGKLVLLMEILADAEAVGDKVLVFSQSLVTLDLIEKVLGGGEIGGDRENWCRGCDYFRMDGSTSAALRQRWADSFNDKDNNNARLFLISTRAGGLGINLVAANRVIVFDVSWNPSHDVQSIFRVYRFGQGKAVYVYRLIAQGTMEEKIYDRQVTKLSMSGRVIDEQQIERHFTAADLRELYSFAPDMLDEEKEKEAEKEAQERPTLPLPKDAVLADLINRLHPKWIVNYLEHDSLLQNIESEELTEEEMKAAWEAYEAEKSGLTMGNAARRQGPPQENYAQTQQNVAERIRINAEMLRQIQQIRQLQEIQQRQEMEERVQRIRREREQLYQRQRQALIQQHQRQQDERRRQNELRFIQHMTQQPVQRLHLAQPLSVQTQHQAAAASQGSAYNQSRIAYQPMGLQFISVPPLRPPSLPMATPSSTIPPSASNLTQTPTTQVTVSQLPVAPQTAPAAQVRPPTL